MGKPEDDEFSRSSTAIGAEGVSGSNADRGGCRFSRFIGLRCLLALLLGISVFLSAIFWLPPFLKLADLGDSDLDPRYKGHTIVARFTLKKTAAYLKDNVEQLETDIYYELEAARTKVTVLSLESLPGSNETDVVFGVDPESKHSSIAPAELSLIRASFGYLVIRQTNLQLTTSLFGQPSIFEVLKFPGGITVSPPQNAYPLQKVQILFNFTLNNSILQIQENFEDLRNQLKSGLHLTYNENLHIQLTNFRGSTVAPPATVQASVVLFVGIPSGPRLKQLAQTIRDSPVRNLGLNNRVFGKVKQVSLSSILQHSLNGDASSSPAPAPSPMPHVHHHHHHHHHHHDHDHSHHQDHGTYLPPSYAPSYSPVGAPARPIYHHHHDHHRSAPSPVKSHQAVPVGAPAPLKSYQANPPTTLPPVKSYHAGPPGCRFRFKGRHKVKTPAPSPTGLAFRPIVSPHHSPVLPHPHANSPTPVVHRISPTSPLPNVIYARVPPPSGTKTDPQPPDKMPSIALSPSSGGRILATHWGFSVLVASLLFHLL